MVKMLIFRKSTFGFKNDLLYNFLSNLYFYYLRYPALQGLICYLLNIFCFVKNVSFNLKGFKPPGPGWWRGRDHIETKTFLGQVGMCVQNFIKISAEVLISISPPHTNRQTNICMPIFIDIEDR